MSRYVCKINILEMRKIIILGALLVTFLLCGTACSNKKENNEQENKDISAMDGKFINNAANLELGTYNRMPEPEINADDIPEKNENAFYTIIAKLQSCNTQIEQLLEGSYGYEKEHKELARQIKEFLNEKNPNRAVENKVYIMPVFTWDCIEKEFFFNSPMLIIYSKNSDELFKCYLRCMGEEKYSDVYVGELNQTYKEALEENWERGFCFIDNVRYTCLLDNKNRTTGTWHFDLDIKGDYYNKLQEFGIDISLKKLIDDKNLYEFDI